MEIEPKEKGGGQESERERMFLQKAKVLVKRGKKIPLCVDATVMESPMTKTVDLCAAVLIAAVKRQRPLL